MHENVVSSAEGNIERLEVGASKCQQHLCCDSEDHKWIVETLIYQRKFASLAQECIDELADDHSIEICRLAVFYSFSSEANWLISDWTDLEDVASSLREHSGVVRLTPLLFAIESGHS